MTSNNLTIVLVLVTLLVLGVTGFVAKALVTSIVRDTKVVSAKNKANDQLKTDLDAAPKLVDSYSALGSESTTLADALPDTIDFPSLLVTLQNMATDSGITLKSVSSGGAGGAVASVGAPVTSTPTSVGTTPTSTVTSPQPYGFTIEFGGSYQSLQQLLGDVETSARPMRVVGLQLTGSISSLSGELDITTYYQARAQWPFSTETIK